MHASGKFCTSVLLIGIAPVFAWGQHAFLYGNISGTNDPVSVFIKPPASGTLQYFEWQSWPVQIPGCWARLLFVGSNRH